MTGSRKSKYHWSEKGATQGTELDICSQAWCATSTRASLPLTVERGEERTGRFHAFRHEDDSHCRSIDGIMAFITCWNTHPMGRTMCDFNVGYPASYYEVRCSELSHKDDKECTACCQTGKQPDKPQNQRTLGYRVQFGWIAGRQKNGRPETEEGSYSQPTRLIHRRNSKYDIHIGWLNIEELKPRREDTVHLTRRCNWRELHGFC
uniref:Peptidase M12A domain-containing protein n=1 Tax=Steinernema glaseri TaxID=37863 RepID=A0A1I8A6S7_9BILA